MTKLTQKYRIRMQEAIDEWTCGFAYGMQDQLLLISSSEDLKQIARVFRMLGTVHAHGLAAAAECLAREKAAA